MTVTTKWSAPADARLPRLRFVRSHVSKGPAADIDIDAAMEARRDLVEPVHTLKQVVCEGIELQMN